MGQVRVINSSMTSYYGESVSHVHIFWGLWRRPYRDGDHTAIGFKSPAIFPPAAAVPMSMPIPNRIELPYGQGAPLHVQALNWHDLLALMARLSNTALVPVSRAVALTQSAFKLRVVVNFVKVSASNPLLHATMKLETELTWYPLGASVF